MECPHCGNTDSKVIDSRLTRDGITIRRLRQCLACSDRFTTYESTEERLLSFLISDSAGQGAAITNSRSMLSIMSGTLTVLSEEIEKLIDKVEKLEKTQVARTAGSKKRAPAKKKAESLISPHQIAKVIRSHIQPEGLTLDEAVKDYEKGLILEALDKSNWVKAKAARLLHMNRTTLVEKIKNQNLAETLSLK